MHEILNDICTVIGSLVGVGGLVVSIISLKKAKKVENTLKMFTNEMNLTHADNSKINNKLKKVNIGGSFVVRDSH